jgi:hypothetical protein
VIYLIGSLRNPRIPEVAGRLRAAYHEIFDDWYAVGPRADDHWKDYEQARGHTFAEALDGHAAQNTFAFDSRHLDRASSVVLVLPAGKSGHMEFGWALGKGKRGIVLLDDDPDRWDVMYRFATKVVSDVDGLLTYLDYSRRHV